MMLRVWDPRTLTVEDRAQSLFVLAMAVAFASLTLTVALHHEPWRDEADGWLFARDGSLTDLLGYTRHGGTPALWLLLLMPFAKLGCPYVTQSILHVLIATGSVIVLAAFAPLPPLTKILVAFSYFFSYEYAVVARSYTLAILLTFIAATIVAGRKSRPILLAIVVALLFNTNAQGFAIAAAFLILYGREWRGLLIMLSGAFLSWLQVRPPADPARHAAIHAPIPDVFQWTVANAFFPTGPVLLGFIFGMLVLLTVTVALRRSRDALLVLWLPLAAMSLLYVFVWIGGLRHVGFFIVVVIVGIWIGAPSVEPRSARAAAILLNASLIASCLVAVRFWSRELNESFSGAHEMAQFIRDRHLATTEIAAHNLTQCEALLPYLPGTRFWYAGLGEYGTYMKWDAAFERALNVPYPVAEERARRNFAGKRWLLLLNVEMPDPGAHGFRLVYTNRRPVFEKTDERYWLYAPLR